VWEIELTDLVTFFRMKVMRKKKKVVRAREKAMV
jgi:hypothetical protein